MSFIFSNDEQHHAPIKIHPLFIKEALLWIIHLNPWQCGERVKNGEIKKPYRLNGTQISEYICDAK